MRIMISILSHWASLANERLIIADEFSSTYAWPSSNPNIPCSEEGEYLRLGDSQMTTMNSEILRNTDINSLLNEN